VYCVVVWQHNIFIVCEMCACVVVCYIYGFFTLLWCSSIYVCCVYCTFVCQRVICNVYVLYDSVAAVYRYVISNVI